MTLDKQAPILVFDSGVGGISVLRWVIKEMPCEDIIYFGDSANAPYGTRSKEELQELIFAHVENYLARGIKGVCVACNTATSAAVRLMREKYPELPIVGIEPAIKPAVEAGTNQRVLVLATPFTIEGSKLRHLEERFEKEAEIFPLAAPGLMEYVERGETDGPQLEAFLKELLSPFVGKVDSVVLGCTHYPFVADMVSAIMGKNVKIFEGGQGTAREMRRRLMVAGLLKDDCGEKGEVTIENSLEGHAKEEKIQLSVKLLTLTE